MTLFMHVALASDLFGPATVQLIYVPTGRLKETFEIQCALAGG